MTDHYEKPWEGPISQGCLNCPPVEPIAPMDMLVAVGFGCAMVTQDGKPVYYETDDMGEDDFWTVRQAEEAALNAPDADWRIVMEGPLRGRTYQRQGVAKWVLIDSNPGFA